MIDPQELWFNTPDSPTLCRGGGNGPAHPSQLYALNKYWWPRMRMLDYGAGSGTTYEALKNEIITSPARDMATAIYYTGVDIIPKNTAWCKEQWPEADWQVNPSLHKIDQPDKSFDVVYSRHVVDHMESFEKAMDEHKRVAKKLVIVILWVPFSDKDEHEIKNIDYRPSGGKLYPNEYTNQYSKNKVLEYLKSDPEWELLECTEDVGAEVSGHDTVIVLRRKNAS